MSRRIDLNCDLGESFGAYTMGNDEAMLRLITSANVACGMHGGDPEVMATTFATARENGVAVGAHPGFPDLWGFGRRPMPFTPAELERLVAYQIGAAMGVAALAGARITHVKAHGALGNMASADASIARAVARAVKAVDSSLWLIAIAGTQSQIEGEKAGLSVASEIYADRTYNPDGTLTSRQLPNAMVHDPKEAAERIVDMVTSGSIIATDGSRLPVRMDTICIHGDGRAAVATAEAVRGALIAAGIELRPFIH